MLRVTPSRLQYHAHMSIHIPDENPPIWFPLVSCLSDDIQELSHSKHLFNNLSPSFPPLSDLKRRCLITIKSRCQKCLADQASVNNMWAKYMQNVTHQLTT